MMSLEKETGPREEPLQVNSLPAFRHELNKTVGRKAIGP